ncbi:reverse transcriptase domain-containing protein [Tanacetum coccineum]
MSSPDHPTANLEDSFSSNFPNYVPPASSDYVPASPGKTYSSASNLFGIAPPTLSLFPDDPYMKALQAFYTEKSPIPPPIIIPPKTQEFFLPEGLLSPTKSSSSTPLDAIHIERIEYIENGIEGLRKGTIIIQRDFNALEAELQQAHTLISKLQRKQIGSNHKISLARYRIAELAEVINDMETQAQAATMTSASNPNRNTGPTGTPAVKTGNYKEFISLFSRSRCAEENKVTFATGTLTDDALSWWNAYAQPIGIEQANQITWTELKRLLTNNIEGNVTASKPQTLEEAINIAQRLMDQVTKHASMQVSSDNKRKFDDRRTFNNNSRNNNNYRNTNNRYNNRQQQNRRQEAGRAYAITLSENSRYAGELPLCKRCNFHHNGPCTGKCNICNKVGHLSKNCRNKKPATGSNQLPVTIVCHACGEKGHYTNQYRKTNINTQGRAYMLKDRNAQQDPNVVTSMFLLNQHLVKVLFDSGADRSFISISLASKLNILSITIDTFYDIEMADRNLILQSLQIFGQTIDTTYHPETDGQSERTIQTLEDMLRAYVIDFGKGWDKHLPLCRSPVCWAEVEDSQLTGPEIIQETTEKIVQIRQRLQAARDRQRSYANVRRKSLEFQVGDRVMLKVSPLAYKLELPEELSSIHNTFHVSNLKKCLFDESLVIPIKELQLDDKLNFVEEPVEVMDREIKQLKRSRIPIIKVRWNSKRGPEFTWEREDEIHAKYPHLFSIITSSSIKSRDEISVRGGDYNNPQFS